MNNAFITKELYIEMRKRIWINIYLIAKIFHFNFRIFVFTFTYSIFIRLAHFEKLQLIRIMFNSLLGLSELAW